MKDQEFSLNGELVKQRGDVSHFCCAFNNGAFDIIMDTKSLQVYTVEVDNSEAASECFDNVVGIDGIVLTYDSEAVITALNEHHIDLTNAEENVLMSKIHEWCKDFPGDEWHGLSDRYDMNGWIDADTCYISLYPVKQTKDGLTTDTSKWWTIFEHEVTRGSY